MRNGLNRSLAALSAMAMVLLPAAPALHRALASHDHLYCVEHDVFEDVPAGTAGGVEAAAGADAYAAGRDSGSGRAHVACGFLSHNSPAARRPLDDRLAPATSLVLAKRALAAPAAASWPVLIRAPKHSPPTLPV